MSQATATQPSVITDAPFHLPDLEWLYRPHDQDGRALASRLGKLAPVSFTNPVDGLRRRRLFSLDSWEATTFVWANDNNGTDTKPLIKVHPVPRSGLYVVVVGPPQPD